MQKLCLLEDCDTRCAGSRAQPHLDSRPHQTLLHLAKASRTYQLHALESGPTPVPHTSDEWTRIVGSMTVWSKGKGGRTWIHGSTTTTATTAIKEQSWMSLNIISASHIHLVGPSTSIGAAAPTTDGTMLHRLGNQLATDWGALIRVVHEQRR